MVMLLWAQVGFSMVLLSAAIKGVPADTLEAARIDGANERQIFFRVVVPQIKGTIITVFITVTIGVMKIFDIVYVTTNGNFNTNVLGNEFYNQLFTNFNNGAAAAIVVILMIAVIPIMIYQVRHFKAEEASHEPRRPRRPQSAAPEPRKTAQGRRRRRGQPRQGRLAHQDRPGRHLLPVDGADPRHSSSPRSAPLDDANTTGWWTVFSHLATLAPDARQLQRGAHQANARHGRARSSTASRSRCRRRSSRS